MKLIYISGPYTAYDDRTVDDNIQHARAAAVRLMQAGWAVICPHLNTAHMEHDGIEYEQFIKADLEIVRRCDAIYVLNGWDHSDGSQKEASCAHDNDLTMYFEACHPSPSPTTCNTRNSYYTSSAV